MKAATSVEFVILGAVLGVPVGFLGLFLFLWISGSGTLGSEFGEVRRILSYRPVTAAALGAVFGAGAGYAAARATQKPRGPDKPPAT